MAHGGLTPEEREMLLRQLAAMPGFLETALLGLEATEASAAGPDGGFSPVEHCWHLADLERQGYGFRLRRLLVEEDPWLPDFDGGRVARERVYRSRSLADGVRTFRSARIANLSLLRSLDPSEWSRPGLQEGVGGIVLGDVPAMMAAHDTEHRAEIAAWLRARPAGAMREHAAPAVEPSLPL